MVRKENESLEPLQSLLHSIQVCRGSEILKNISLPESDEQDGEDDEHLIHSIEDVRSFPYKDIHLLCVSVCGVKFERNPFRASDEREKPQLTVLWDAEVPSAKLVFYLDLVKVSGVLTNSKVHWTTYRTSLIRINSSYTMPT